MNYNKSFKTDNLNLKTTQLKKNVWYEFKRTCPTVSKQPTAAQKRIW
jgi:hypothetical protein